MWSVEEGRLWSRGVEIREDVDSITIGHLFVGGLGLFIGRIESTGIGWMKIEGDFSGGGGSRQDFCFRMPILLRSPSAVLYWFVAVEWAKNGRVISFAVISRPFLNGEIKGDFSPDAAGIHGRSLAA